MTFQESDRVLNRLVFALSSALAFRRALLLFAAALVMLPAAAAENAAGKARLAKLQIEIWPEYDQPSALVFLKGELAPGADRSITLRIPAASGGPLAVAQSNTAGGNLLNLPYERTDGKDIITLRMQVPDRFFHIEFYDRINTGNDKREYRYVWPGDIAADNLSVHVQQPATARDFAITPAFSESGTGGDSLLYWRKEMGAAPAGKALSITLRYTKSDVRTTKQIIGEHPPETAGASAPAAKPLDVDAVKPDETLLRGSTESREDWIPAIFLAVLALVTAGVLWFRWRRERKADGVAGAARFCSKCGNALHSGDRFCAKCGQAAA
jgi:hypothetical protein